MTNNKIERYPKTPPKKCVYANLAFLLAANRTQNFAQGLAPSAQPTSEASARNASATASDHFMGMARRPASHCSFS